MLRFLDLKDSGGFGVLVEVFHGGVVLDRRGTRKGHTNRHFQGESSIIGIIDI